MRRFAKTLPAVVSVALVAGCSSPSDTTPAACLNGPAVYERALRAAPGEVALPGGVPISDCLAENQKAGDLARVGESLVVTATRLSFEGRERPRGPAPLELGYLVGAAERGAESTAGIHADLIRRLNSAALPPVSPRAYRRGFAAGSARG